MPTILHTKAKRQPPKQANNELKPLDFLPVNRNLHYWPIARSERAKVEWRRNTKGGYRYYRVHDVEIRLPLDCGLARRHATGFDVAVLLTLTGIAKARKRADIRVTNTDILRSLGLSAKSGYNRNKVTSALEFWQRATIVWPNWYTPKLGKAELIVERPIEKVARGYVKMNKEWIATATSRYYASIPCPLPTEAAVQNLLLFLVGWRKAKSGEHDGKAVVRLPFRSRRQITRRIGLDHHERNLQLLLTLEKLKWWFEQHEGILEIIENEDDSIELLGYLPPKPVRNKHK